MRSKTIITTILSMLDMNAIYKIAEFYAAILLHNVYCSWDEKENIVSAPVSRVYGGMCIFSCVRNFNGKRNLIWSTDRTS